MYLNPDSEVTVLDRKLIPGGPVTFSFLSFSLAVLSQPLSSLCLFIDTNAYATRASCLSSGRPSVCWLCSLCSWELAPPF